MSSTTFRGPRRNLRSSRELPAVFGARHPLMIEELPPIAEKAPREGNEPKQKGPRFRLEADLDIFLGLLNAKWRKVIPDEAHTADGMETSYSSHFEIYNDPKKVGMSVVERRAVTGHAKRNRIQWNANDYGRVTSEIADGIGAEKNRLGLTLEEYRPLDVTLTDIIPVGDARSRREGRKLAAKVDPDSPEAEFMISEHRIIMDALGGPLQDFKYPYDEGFVPKLIIGRIHLCAEPEQVQKCAMAAQVLLPVTVRLLPVAFLPEEAL